jgi:hypothetical protein
MTPKAVIERYAHRMNIEQRLAESIRSFHTDALSSAVPLNVDLTWPLRRLSASLPGTLASPRTGLSPAGYRELVARLRQVMTLYPGVRAPGRTPAETLKRTALGVRPLRLIG